MRIRNNNGQTVEKSYFQKIKSAYLLISVIYIVFGLSLLIWPETSTRTICYAIGAILFIYAITAFIKYFTSGKEKNFYQIDFITGIITFIIGLIVILKPEIIVSIVPTVLGIILVISSIIKLQDAIELKRNNYEKWEMVLTFSIAVIILGVIMIINPFGIGLLFTRFIGASFVIDGVLSITSNTIRNVKVK